MIFTLVSLGFIGLLVFNGVFNDHSTRAAGSNHIVDTQGHGDFTTIQQAIDNATVGDTIYVWAGTYYENVIINKTITLLGNGTSNTTINGGGSGNVVEITADHANLTGFIITASGTNSNDAGVKLNGVNKCNISSIYCLNNKLGILLNSGSSYNWIANSSSTNNEKGIDVRDSSFNSLLNNTCTNNNIYGIEITNSNNNKLITNTCSNNGNSGIRITNSEYNELIENECLNNEQIGIYLESSSNHELKDNICDYSIYSSGILLASSNENHLINNSCQNNAQDGLDFYRSNQNIIEANNLSGNVIGIHLWRSNNNIFNNNTACESGYDGLNIYSSNFNIFNNNTFNSNQNDGIYQEQSTNNYYYFCTCKDNGYSGIELSSPAMYTTISNCNLSYNSNGLILWQASFCEFKNNSIFNNNVAIDGWLSSYCTYQNNTCVNSEWNNIAIYQSSYNILDSNICKDGPSYGSGIQLMYASNNNIIRNNVCSDSYFGIYLLSSPANKIENNTCNSNYMGIILESEVGSQDKSYRCAIQNNTCDSNTASGISISASWYTSIENNSCSFNNKGILIHEYSNYSEIKNNYCYANSGGIWLEDVLYNGVYNNSCHHTENGIIVRYANENIVNNNNCSSSLEAISIEYSDYCIVENNTCKSTSKDGLNIQSSNSISIKNNICSDNGQHGILVNKSKRSIIANNTCNSNDFDGIYLFMCEMDQISNNSCNRNLNGIEFIYSKYNKINGNELSKNQVGLFLDIISTNNDIFNNTISHNSEVGISLHEKTDENFIFFNAIISNQKQAIDDGTNTWNNRHQEGNYWSDYKGVDNGANNRTLGDGIGDTNIPHLNLDYYPFTDSFGWLQPRPPLLLDPGEIDFDGNYILEWVSSSEGFSFILQEDNNTSFDTPAIIYQGPADQFKFNDKTDGTYYYRVRAYLDDDFSNWSNIVDIIVDQHPKVPKNLTAKPWPEGNAINISWDLNFHDITQYRLYYKYEETWMIADTIKHPSHTFNHTNLTDGVRYYYKLQTIDNTKKYSEFCESVSCIPKDSVPPPSPTGLNVINVTFNSIILTWNVSIAFDLAGYNIYRSNTSEPSSWGEPINGNNSLANATYTDNNVQEGTTYYYVVSALDEVPNESPYSNSTKVRILTYKEYPQPPRINNSLSNFSIPEDTWDNTSINMLHWFSDINEDKLSFCCLKSENMNTTINSLNGEVALKPKKDWNGLVTLTFHVYDGIFNVSANITIEVTPVNDPPGPAQIIAPQKGYKVNIEKQIVFKGQCSDPDLIYGDNLTFTWISNLAGTLGTGEVLRRGNLPTGEHIIILVVSDQENITCDTSINITITGKDTQKGSDLSTTDICIIAGIGVVILTIILILHLLFQKRKKLELPPEELEQLKRKKAGPGEVKGEGAMEEVERKKRFHEEYEKLYGEKDYELKRKKEPIAEVDDSMNVVEE